MGPAETEVTVAKVGVEVTAADEVGVPAPIGVVGTHDNEVEVDVGAADAGDDVTVPHPDSKIAIAVIRSAKFL